MKKFTAMMAAAVLAGTLAGCSDAQAKLKDSNTVLITIGNKNITKGDVYSILNSTYGASTAVTNGNKIIAAAEVEATDEMKKQAEETLENYKSVYGDTFTTYLEQTGMTEEEYTDRLKMTEERYLNLDFKPISDLIAIDYSKVDLSKYATFTKMIDDFKPGMGYANEPVGDTDVFFVSSACYNGENDTKNAIDSSLFVYDNDSIVMIGQVASIGTAYPVTINDGYIYVGGHHEVFKYTVKEGKLILSEEASEVFDTAGNATYYYAKDGSEAEEVKDDSNLTRIFDEYFSGKPVEYSVVQ